MCVLLNNLLFPCWRKKVCDSLAVHTANLSAHHTHKITPLSVNVYVSLFMFVYVCVHACGSTCECVWEGPLCQEH